MPQSRLSSAIKAHPPQLTPSSFPVRPPSSPAARPSHPHRSLFVIALVAFVLIGGGVAHANAAAAKPPSVATTDEGFATFVAEASQRFGIPPSLIRAVMKAESAGDVQARSPKGAIGLMQLMPETWATLQVRYGLGADPYDTHDNILAGAAYLRELHDRYGERGFLAAYNAGPARYEDHLATGRPLPGETQAFLAALAPMVGDSAIDGTERVKATARSWTDAPLFVAHAESNIATPSVSSRLSSLQSSARKAAADWTALAPQSNGLFVTISRRTHRP